MGLFNFLKRQLLEVIEWKDDSKDIMVYRFPLENREEIMNSSTLIVRESQVALFVHKGQICDVFGPGSYKLATENIPILTKIMSLPTGLNSPIKAEVYFVNTKQFTGCKWGTQNPVMMRDADFGTVRLRGFGIYSFKVDNAKTFMKEVFGTNRYYKVNDLTEQVKPMVIQSLIDAVAESKISALDLAANYKEFGDTVLKCSEAEFSKLGLKLCSFVIENISLPEEVEKVLDERSKIGILEDKMGSYTQYQTAQAIKDAANNPNGGNLAGLGVGLGAGGAVGQLFAQSLTTENHKKEVGATCVKCGAKLKESAKFCAECGAKQCESCPKCGANITNNAKFCGECGESLIKKCSSCGAEVKTGAKFCGECGNKVE